MPIRGAFSHQGCWCASTRKQTLVHRLQRARAGHHSRAWRPTTDRHDMAEVEGDRSRLHPNVGFRGMSSESLRFRNARF